MVTTREHIAQAVSDRYEILKELGRGGMATVYLAHDKEDDRQVAIKVMRRQVAEAMGAERFLLEIDIARSLDHPNILALIDSGKTEDTMFYVMPFVDGESLGERIEREGQMAVDEVVRITRQVASALTYAHGKGVIHRDIKPDNIMVGSDGQAVVMDFGIGRALEAGGEKITQTGMSVGTPAYMSPEQAMGERNLDGRTDVYALAAVVYEMLIGEPPFTGPTAQAIIAKRFSGHVPSVTQRRGVVSRDIDGAVQRALAKEPADRFATADQFVAAMTGEEASPASSSKASGCRSTAALLVVIVTVAVAGGVGLFL
jgi:serine/threonine-protein kinase